MDAKRKCKYYVPGDDVCCDKSNRNNTNDIGEAWEVSCMCGYMSYDCGKTECSEAHNISIEICAYCALWTTDVCAMI